MATALVCGACSDPLTCEAGIAQLFPPFLGNVKIENFELSRTIAVTGDKIVARGRALIQPFLILPWRPFDNAAVEIKIYSPGVKEPLVFKGRTDSEGRFNITIEAPFVFSMTMFNVFASLPEPHRVDCSHLECGPIVLTVYPSVEELPSEERKRREEERWELIKKAILYGSIGLIGIGLLWTAVKK
jgi:hypothetical protein